MNNDVNCKKRTILIVNQHGENRGDEAALRAMLRGIEGAANEHFIFIVLAQHRDKKLPLSFEQDVVIVNMIMPVLHALGLLTYSLLSIVRIKPRLLLSKETLLLIKSYEQCELVISSPGGPYFGDIYIGHELVHWFFIWLAVIYKKTLLLYAPSAGPFKNKMMNVVRRYLYAKFNKVIFREAESADHFLNLCSSIDYEITADSALQEKRKKLIPVDYLSKSTESDYLVAISVLDYAFKGAENAKQLKKNYEMAIRDTICYINSKKNVKFMFMPQLYGSYHSDIPYLLNIAKSLPDSIDWEILSDAYDSDIQRGLIAACDFCIASRYHPQIFAYAAGVPVIGIYYEHKSIGFMELAGITDYSVSIRDVSGPKLIALYDTMLNNQAEVKKLFETNVDKLRALSNLSSKRVAELLSKK